MQVFYLWRCSTDGDVCLEKCSVFEGIQHVEVFNFNMCSC